MTQKLRNANVSHGPTPAARKQSHPFGRWTTSAVTAARPLIGGVVLIILLLALMTDGSPGTAPTALAQANNDPVGSPTITGLHRAGQTLTADASGISDGDGLGTFSYSGSTTTAQAKRT